MACIDPYASSFLPSNNTPWTIRNKDSVRVFQICKFHTAQKGNLCAYGDFCPFIHYEECHRANIAEINVQRTLQQQLADTLGQMNVVLSAILTALTSQCFSPQKAQRTNDEPTGDDVKHDTGAECDDDAVDMAKSAAAPKDAIDDDAEADIKVLREVLKVEAKQKTSIDSTATTTVSAPPSAIKTAEALTDIAKKVEDGPVDKESDADTEHTVTKLHIGADDEIDIKLDDEMTDNAPRFKAQWQYLLGNHPDLLFQRYPETRDEYWQRFTVGDNDAELINLKFDALNGQPVVVKDYVKDKDRFHVELFNYAAKPKARAILRKNVMEIEPIPASKAYQHFKGNVAESTWDKLTRGGTSYDNEAIIHCFIAQQFPLYDSKKKAYVFVDFKRLNKGYQQLHSDTIREVTAKGFAVTESDCPKILSVLYSFSFIRKLHVVRTFSIPETWQMQKWNDELYVPLPVSAIT